MNEKSRKVHRADFKAKVGIEALRETKTTNELGQEYGIHPVQVRQWKKEIVEGATVIFETKRGPKRKDNAINEEVLYGEIGRLKMELDWLKKKSGLNP